MWRVPTFCQPFFMRETRKLIAMVTFCLICSSESSAVPTEQPMQLTFFDWNLTVCLSSSILVTIFSPSTRLIGNRFILTRTLPSSLVTCLPTVSEARRMSYFLAHFLILTLSLLKALRPSMSIKGISLAFASSMWTALARTQI